MISKLRTLIGWMIPAAFITLVLLSLFGGILGIDPDMKWGPIRIGLLFIGAAGILVVGLLRAIAIIDERILGRDRRLSLAHLSSESVLPSGEPVTSGRPPWIAIVMVALVLGVVYVGLVSVWHWTNWPTTTDYYGMLGDAFVHGKTYLPLAPPPELAKLSDPYSSEARKGLSVIGDLSYYQGRYYLYWGPAPAAALAGLELLGFPPMGDQMVVFGAVCPHFHLWGLDHPQAMAVFGPQDPWLAPGRRHRRFRDRPSDAMDLKQPIYLYSLECCRAGFPYRRSSSFITVASTGLSVKSLDLALAGMFWGLAIATQGLTTGAAVVVLLLGAVVLIGAGAWRMQDWRQAASQLLALGLPFAVVMLIYGYYNFVRFGNFLEPGFRFQLTEANKSVQFAHDQLFSLQFLIPNSLYHFFAPLQLRSHFPFLRPVYGEYLPFSQFIKRLGIVPGPGIGAITGLILAAPTLALNLPLLSRLLSAAGPTEIASKPAVERSSRQGFIVPLGHIGLVFFLAGVASSLPVLAYTYAASRYDLDFVPLLALSSVIGMWYLYEDSRPYPLRSKLAVLLIVALVVTSTAISFVLALSGAGSKFDDFNPSLYRFLVAFFSR